MLLGSLCFSIYDDGLMTIHFDPEINLKIWPEVKGQVIRSCCISYDFGAMKQAQWCHFHMSVQSSSRVIRKCFPYRFIMGEVKNWPGPYVTKSTETSEIVHYVGMDIRIRSWKFQVSDKSRNLGTALNFGFWEDHNYTLYVTVHARYHENFHMCPRYSLASYAKLQVSITCRSGDFLQNVKGGNFMPPPPSAWWVNRTLVLCSLRSIARWNVNAQLGKCFNFTFNVKQIAISLIFTSNSL